MDKDRQSWHGRDPTTDKTAALEVNRGPWEMESIHDSATCLCTCPARASGCHNLREQDQLSRDRF